MDYLHHYQSPIGSITIAGSGDAIIGLWFNGQKHFAEGLDANRKTGTLPIFAETDRWLDLYFSGRKPGFRPKLCMRSTSFRKAVWEILLSIPYGQTMTYGDVAAEMGMSGRAVRAIGNAVGHNPISLIIPCHRVVGANGRLTGYTGGIEKKAFLLNLEQEGL